MQLGSAASATIDEDEDEDGDCAGRISALLAAVAELSKAANAENDTPAAEVGDAEGRKAPAPVVFRLPAPL